MSKWLGTLQKARSRLLCLRYGRHHVAEATKSQAFGASPEGAKDPQATSRAIRDMFTAIAPRYDLLNHLLSANVDKLWWRHAAQAFAAILSRPDVRVLDLCCGTGDMAFALRRRGKHARIIGVDFSRAMLELARTKQGSTWPMHWIEADALRLP